LVVGETTVADSSSADEVGGEEGANADSITLSVHVIGAGGGARLAMVAATMHRRWTNQRRTRFAAPG